MYRGGRPRAPAGATQHPGVVSGCLSCSGARNTNVSESHEASSAAARALAACCEFTTIARSPAARSSLLLVEAGPLEISPILNIPPGTDRIRRPLRLGAAIWITPLTGTRPPRPSPTCRSTSTRSAPAPPWGRPRISLPTCGNAQRGSSVLQQRLAGRHDAAAGQDRGRAGTASRWPSPAGVLHPEPAAGNQRRTADREHAGHGRLVRARAPSSDTACAAVHRLQGCRDRRARPSSCPPAPGSNGGQPTIVRNRGGRPWCRRG